MPRALRIGAAAAPLTAEGGRRGRGPLGEELAGVEGRGGAESGGYMSILAQMSILAHVSILACMPVQVQHCTVRLEPCRAGCTRVLLCGRSSSNPAGACCCLTAARGGVSWGRGARCTHAWHQHNAAAADAVTLIIIIIIVVLFANKTCVGDVDSST